MKQSQEQFFVVSASSDAPPYVIITDEQWNALF